MSKNINVRIALKRDTSANWTNYNPVLLNGELILVDTAEGQLRVKIGDGIKTYTQLPFTDEALRALITEVDNNNSAVVVTKNGESRLLNTFNIIKLTQEEYEELETSNSLDPDALYLTEGGSENIGGSKVVLTQDGVGKELPVFNIVKLSEEEYNQLFDSNTLDPDTLYLTEGNSDEGLTEVNEGTPSNISGLVKGNGSTLQAAQAGTDYQAPIVETTATLVATDWVVGDYSITQAVSVDGVRLRNKVIISPDINSMEEYLRTGIYCAKQSYNALTFQSTVTTPPTNDLTINVLIMG